MRRSRIGRESTGLPRSVEDGTGAQRRVAVIPVLDQQNRQRCLNPYVHPIFPE